MKFNNSNSISLNKMSKSIVCDLLHIFKSSVSAVLPGNFVRKSLKYSKHTQELCVAGDKYDLQQKNVYVVGAGKAVQHMALEVENILGSKIKTGIISIPVGSLIDKLPINKNMLFCEGAKNNFPDKNAINTARNIEKLVLSLQSDDFLLVLISGGGSALLSLPKPKITLEEKLDLTKRLAYAGADIKELNTVRKRLSELKGGQLAIKAYPAQVVALILSDIVGDPLHLIASGPTTEDEEDCSKAWIIIDKYNLQNDIPESIASTLNNQLSYDKKFPKDRVHNYLIGCNKLSTEAAFNECTNLNYTPIIFSNSITGNVKTIARKYVNLSKLFYDFIQGNLTSNDLKNGLQSIEIPGVNTEVWDKIGSITNSNNFCIIFGGEITVEVRGTGKGGRNQQLALEFSNLIHNIKNELKDFNIFMLSAGTDGIDGPTDAAGAIGYTNLVTDAINDGLNVEQFLQNNDSYNFYKNFKNGELHVFTGHTNTNVMDIHLIIIQKKIK